MAFGRPQTRAIARGKTKRSNYDKDRGDYSMTVTGVHSSKLTGAASFDVFAVDNRTDKTIWLAVIRVDKDLSVYVAEEEGKVPYEFLECALSGP
jgi:hypothetical protein